LNPILCSFSKDLEILGTKCSGQAEAPASSKLANSTISFVDAFNFAQEQSDFRMVVRAGWRLMESISPMGKRMKTSLRVIDDFAYSLIDERIASLSKQNRFKEEDSTHRDLLSLFMDARDDRGGGLGRVELRDTAMSLLFAGR
jgi:cytochrome P450